MNERILKLAEKADIKINQMILDDILYDYWEVEMDGADALEKFANLIIQECVNACLEEADKFRGSQDITDFKICAMVIKERFET